MIISMRIPLAFCALAAAWTASADDSFAKTVSGPGTLIFVAGGSLLPFVRDGQDAKNHGWRTLEALGISMALGEGLKRATRVPRPDSGAYDSFPSTHATAAFTIATMQATWRPREAIYWYAGATLIANSRLSLNRHRIGDLLGGAALGFLTAKFELSKPRGLFVRPLVTDEGGFGLSISTRF